MIITISEQIGRGNFAGDTDEEQGKAANKFAQLLRSNLEEYISVEYPGAEMKFDLSVENVSGCCSPFDVDVEPDDDDIDYKLGVESEIKQEYNFICALIAEEIYE